ncbi:hypothetical protein ALO56_04558, partial [Pseudomonas viridiflava]
MPGVSLRHRSARSAQDSLRKLLRRPDMPVQLLQETPSQTAGPYVHIGLAPQVAGNPPRELEIWNEMARPGAPGE